MINIANRRVRVRMKRRNPEAWRHPRRGVRGTTRSTSSRASTVPPSGLLLPPAVRRWRGRARETLPPHPAEPGVCPDRASGA